MDLFRHTTELGSHVRNIVFIKSSFMWFVGSASPCYFSCAFQLSTLMYCLWYLCHWFLSGRSTLLSLTDFLIWCFFRTAHHLISVVPPCREILWTKVLFIFTHTVHEFRRISLFSLARQNQVERTKYAQPILCNSSFVYSFSERETSATLIGFVPACYRTNPPRITWYWKGIQFQLSLIFIRNIAKLCCNLQLPLANIQVRIRELLNTSTLASSKERNIGRLHNHDGDSYDDIINLHTSWQNNDFVLFARPVRAFFIF